MDEGNKKCNKEWRQYAINKNFKHNHANPKWDNLLIKLRRGNAQIPKRANKYATGLDIFSCEEGVIEPGTRKVVNTGIEILTPKNTYARIAPRSGLSLKGIDIGGGVIDVDYRGEIKVIMINNSKEVYNYSVGHKIAQMIIEKIVYSEPVIWDFMNEDKLMFEIIAEHDNGKVRGFKGFGSTGN